MSQAFNTPTLLLTVDEAAHELRMSRRKLYDLLMSDEIPSVKHGRQRLVSRRALEAWVDAQEGRSSGHR